MRTPCKEWVCPAGIARKEGNRVERLQASASTNNARFVKRNGEPCSRLACTVKDVCNLARGSKLVQYIYGHHVRPFLDNNRKRSIQMN